MQDDLSTAVLRESWYQEHYAGRSSGNGNCLYNACSIQLCGKKYKVLLFMIIIGCRLVTNLHVLPYELSCRFGSPRLI